MFYFLKNYKCEKFQSCHSGNCTVLCVRQDCVWKGQSHTGKCKTLVANNEVVYNRDQHLHAQYNELLQKSKVKPDQNPVSNPNQSYDLLQMCFCTGLFIFIIAVLVKNNIFSR